MDEWIKVNYLLITKIIVPIIIAIIGIFSYKQLQKKKNNITGDSNNTLVADGNINTNQSYNTTEQNAGYRAVQISGNNNNVNNLDIISAKSLAKTYNEYMFPLAEKAFEKLHLNSHKFLAHLNSEFESLNPSELAKFSEVDVQIALQNAIKSAAKADSIQIHQVLAKLITDRVQKPKSSIAELAINESILVAAKLDVNLIKILALIFVLSRTRYLLLHNEEMLVEKLSLIASEFDGLDITSSKFEYLEAVSCGKKSPFGSGVLINIISKNYPQLFIKKLTLQQIEELTLPSDIKAICFINDNNYFRLNPAIGLYLFENAAIKLNDMSYSIDDIAIKESLKNYLINNRLSEEEIKAFILSRVPKFYNILKFWDENASSHFSLTAVGIAIGRAYIEQKQFGSYDINIWIN